MRRQGVARVSSAQSLCIFCACRLGVNLPPTHLSPPTPPPPILQLSWPTRRHFVLRRPLLQSEASAPSTPGHDAGQNHDGKGDSLPSWYDPQSSLSMSEQREKAARLALLQQHAKRVEAQERNTKTAEQFRANHDVGEARQFRGAQHFQYQRDERHGRLRGGGNAAPEALRGSMRPTGENARPQVAIRRVYVNKEAGGIAEGNSDRGLYARGDRNQTGARPQERADQQQPASAARAAATAPFPGNAQQDTDDRTAAPLAHGKLGISQGPGVQQERRGVNPNPAHLSRYTGISDVPPAQAPGWDPKGHMYQPAPTSDDVSAHWQHIRRRNPNPVQQNPPNLPQPHSPSQKPHPTSTHRADDEGQIDRMFEQHRRERVVSEQRPQQAVQPTSSPSTGDGYARRLYDDEHHKDKECARCQQKGHIARDCPNPLATQRQRVLGTQRSDSTSSYEPFTSRSLFGQQDRYNGLSSDRSSVKYQGASSYSPWGDRSLTAREQATQKYEASLNFTDKVYVPVESRAKDGRGDLARSKKWEHEEVEDDQEPRKGRKALPTARGRGFDEDEDDKEDARDSFRERKMARRAAKEREKVQIRQAARRDREARKAADTTPISLPEFISVQQLSQALGVRYEQFIDRLEALGYDDIFPGMTLNSETSGMIAMEYNFEPTFEADMSDEGQDLKPRPEASNKELLPPRPPVVTIMGHVDHGKTTILDYLRKSSIAAGEAGGITQHIGAFSVPLAGSDKTITFLDTPGHAAFLAMRQRGAHVTDMVILVVAADDSVKPQTLEAIKHAKAAGVPMIVAVNKIDKPEADVQKVKQDLARHGVEIEDFGGETQVVPVSGKTGQGMDDLVENVVTLSEILDQRAEIDGAVEGWVIEATTKNSGRVATLLIRRGTLKPGDVIVAGKTWARVRTLHDEAGRTLEQVGPGMPVEVHGWKDQPMAGDQVIQAPSEQKATSVVEFRIEQEERERAAADVGAINDARRIAIQRQQVERAEKAVRKRAQQLAGVEGGTADVPVTQLGSIAAEEPKSGQINVPFIIKADVSGSAEAVSAYIMSVSNPLIVPEILLSGVGPVHESDIELADTVDGYIIAFNVASDPDVKGLAESKGVKILENNIIYRVLDDVRAVLEEKLPPIVGQRVLGEAEIAQRFEISLGGRKRLMVAGCKIRNGVINIKNRVRVLRNGEKIYDGTLASLKNVKKDVQEMRKGTECGMGFEHWEDFKVGDQVQAYEEFNEKRKL